MTELVGAPVLVSGDGPAATIAQTQLSDSTPSVNYLCCIGSTALLLQCIGFLSEGFAFVAYWVTPVKALQLLRVTPLISCFFSIIGLCVIKKAKSIPGGCECLSCRVPCIPRCLFVFNGYSVLTFINLVKELVSSSGENDEFSFGPEVIVICCVAFFVILLTFTNFWFSFEWNRRFAQQNFTNMQAGGEHLEKEDSLQSSMKGQNVQARFAEMESQESRKFEAAYIVAEAFFFCVLLVFSTKLTNSGEAMTLLRAYSLILLTCFFFRIYRLFFAAPESRLSFLATAFDAFEFSLNGFALGMTGQSSAYASFFLNVLLSYMLLFVFPFQRALLVVPLCYIAYICSAAFVGAKSSVVEESPLQLFCLLGLGLCLNLCAKRMMQGSKWQAFLLIEEKTKLAVQEKVLRFQAEFSSEAVARSLVHQANDEQTSYIDSAPSQEPCALQGKTQASNNAGNGVAHFKIAPHATSIRSAPAMLAPCLEHSTHMHAVNCLPLDALAWVEGEARPKPLADLQPGSRILCYDRLGGSLKHATLLDVQRKDGPVEWTTVTLADGATLEMTSDHPMQPIECQSEESDQMAAKAILSRPGLPVRAADLKPGKQSLVFMQVVPNMVQSVTSLLESRPRMALTIQQPERHALFIASPGGHNNGAIQTMAVESVNVNASSCMQIGHHQSFLTVSSLCEEAESKAASAPPSLNGPTQVKSHMAITDNESVSNASSSFSSADMAELHFGPTPVMSQNITSCANNSSDTRGDAACEELHYRLSDILHLRVAGLQSRGSVHHSDGQCIACVHENKNQLYHSGPCFKGMYCERCHEVHGDIRLEKRREQRRRRREQQATLKSQPPSSKGEMSLDAEEGDTDMEFVSRIKSV